MSDFATSFRSAFPEFADIVKYPDAQVDFWSEFADENLNVDRWEDRLAKGKMLFVAHHLSLAVRNQAAGVISGTNTGIISSESAGGVSVSLDNQSASEERAGNYALTTYGLMFIKLARIVGIGGLQL